jgi:DNA polymerase III subunit gamma/tau
MTLLLCRRRAPPHHGVVNLVRSGRKQPQPFTVSAGVKARLFIFSMSHQVLARKWRPRDFPSLVGQEHVVKALTHALNTQRLHHAYLFTGTRGVGKTTLSRILAKALNCETGVTAAPCGKCGACLDIDSGRFVDYVEMDAASNRSVEEMTTVLDNAMYAPTVGRYKVYVIDEVHMLTNHAFNAMLKTLEEPPPHVIFVLATTDPQKVPVTVLSRCMQFNLRNLAPATIAERLTYVLQQEEVTFDAAALVRLGQAAQGSMRDSLSLLDQAIAFGAGAVSDATVMQMLGLVDSMFVDQIVVSVLNGDGQKLIALADELLANGGAFEQVLTDLAREFAQLALAERGLGEPTAERTSLAQSLGAQALQVYYQIAIHGLRDLHLAPDAHTGFSMVLLRLLAFVPHQNAEPARTTGIAIPRPNSSSNIPKAPVTQPAARPMPVPVPTKGQERSFSGDWPSLAKQVKLVGFAQQFMQQSQLVSYESLNPGYAFTVKVPIKILAESANVNKVKDALSNHLGQPVKLIAEVGTVAEGTAAHIVAEQKAQAQSVAETAIEEDLFVQGLQKEFGATIVPGSVVPSSGA